MVCDLGADFVGGVEELFAGPELVGCCGGVLVLFGEVTALVCVPWGRGVSGFLLCYAGVRFLGMSS